MRCENKKNGLYTAMDLLNINQRISISICLCQGIQKFLVAQIRIII